jgi:Ribbon-helix-helix protein, copG family
LTVSENQPREVIVSRRNIYEQIDYDADWMRRDEKPALLGWFESAKAVFWSDRDHNGNGSGGTGRGQTVWRTAQGKWVLEHWSAWQDEESTYAYITPDEARDWLLRNDEDVAVRDHFGEVAEEEDRRPGRPAIGGEAGNVRLGEERLAEVDAYAKAQNLSRAEAVRRLVDEALRQGSRSAADR